jgi:hypothetical protein
MPRRIKCAGAFISLTATILVHDIRQWFVAADKSKTSTPRVFLLNGRSTRVATHGSFTREYGHRHLLIRDAGDP